MRLPIYALALTLVAGVPHGTFDERPEIQAAHQVRVVYEHSTLQGICTLVDVEPHPGGFSLSFITSARLFKSDRGEPFMPATEVRVIMEDGVELSVPREYRYLPIGGFSDIAVLRADVAANALVPASMGFSPPPPGRAIDIVAFDRDGLRRIQTQHVRFTSTRFMVGDRDLSTFADCLGAPVIDGDEVVGVVSDCEPGRSALVTPLSVAFSFLSRHIPGLTGRPTSR